MTPVQPLLLLPFAVLLHLGGLHPFERALVLVIAFGPFAVLGVVVYVVRRRDLADEEREAGDAREAGQDREPQDPAR